MALAHDTQHFPLLPSLAEKSLPELPTISIESPSRRLNIPDDPCPSPIVRKFNEKKQPSRNSQPQVSSFRQPKRWARIQDRIAVAAAPERAPPSNQPNAASLEDESSPAESDEMELTVREASFERQRAELKPTIAQQARIQDPRHQRNVSDSSSSLQGDGICSSTTTDCWKSVKTSVTLIPHPAPMRWPRKQSISRKAAPMRQREGKRQRSSAGRIPLPPKARFGTNTKTQDRWAPSDEAIQPSTPPRGLRQSINGHNSQGDGRLPRLHPISPISCLNAPEKAGKFSQECMEILNSMTFKGDWSSPSPSIKASATQGSTMRPTAACGVDFRQKNSGMIHPATPSPPIEAHVTLNTLDTVLVPPSLFNQSFQRREHPARVSSKTVASLATMVHMANEQSSDSDKPRNRSGPDLQLQLEVGQPVSLQSSQSQSPLHLPSSTSTNGHTAHTPRSAMSTDTMSRIEAQIQNNLHSNLDKELKKLSFSSADTQDSGPPPERPLPALPAEANLEIHTTTDRQDTSRGPHDDGSKARQAVSSRGSELITIRLVQRSSAFSSPLPSTTNKQDDQLLSPRTPPEQRSDTSNTLARLSKDLGASKSLRTTNSNDSIKSHQLFARPPLQSSRAQKVKEKRMRDLAGSKKGSPEPEPAMINVKVHQHSLRTTAAADGSLSHRRSVDQLDQFPKVPRSRPTSPVGIPAPSHKHGQSNSSDGSGVYRNLNACSKCHRIDRPHQVLGQSNIFVIVDYDPVTARFRAGAMSPAPSIGGSLKGRPVARLQPLKPAQAPSKLKDTFLPQSSPVKCPKEGLSPRSPKGEKLPASGRSSSAFNKNSERLARTDVWQSTSSSDESRQVLNSPGTSPVTKASIRPQKRRRWNSNDITLIQTLQRDLEDYYSTILKQEETIRWQANQIEMMVRVITPMNRARGIQGPLCFEYVADDSTGDESIYGSQMFAGKMPSRGNDLRRARISLGSPTKRPVKQAINKKDHNNPSSTGDNSDTSESPIASNASAKASADDASMTDPCEHETTSSSGHSKTANIPVSSKEILSPTMDKATQDGGATLSARLHGPPPAARVTPKDRLPDEMKFLGSPDPGANPRYYRVLGSTNQQRSGQDEGDEELRVESKRGSETDQESARLSVNHILTRTDEMDRAIDQFR